MPQLLLTAFKLGVSIPVGLPSGGRVLAPRVQFRCWARVPGFLTPRDAILDIGSPYTWMPRAIWSRFQPGIDFAWLPYPAGYTPPPTRTVGWTFTFRFARMLVPLVFHDAGTEMMRDGVIAQFA